MGEGVSELVGCWGGVGCCGDAVGCARKLEAGDLAASRRDELHARGSASMLGALRWVGLRTVPGAFRGTEEQTGANARASSWTGEPGAVLAQRGPGSSAIRLFLALGALLDARVDDIVDQASSEGSSHDWNFSAAPRFTLERHQLAQVICQARFSPVLRLQQQGEVASFQEEVRGRYPVFLPQHAMSVVITPQGVAQQDTGVQNYRFVDPDAGVALALGVDFVGIETRRYVAIEDVIERVREAVAIVERLIGRR